MERPLVTEECSTSKTCFKLTGALYGNHPNKNSNAYIQWFKGFVEKLSCHDCSSYIRDSGDENNSSICEQP